MTKKRKTEQKAIPKKQARAVETESSKRTFKRTLLYQEGLDEKGIDCIYPFVQVPKLRLYLPPKIKTREEISKFIREELSRNYRQPYVLDRDMETETFNALDSAKKEFETTNDSTYAIEALIVAHEAGFYPPIWALECLAEKFSKWYEGKGKTDINSVLGFKTGRGVRDTVLTKEARVARDEKLCLDVIRIKTLCGKSLKMGKIFDMVGDSLEKNPTAYGFRGEKAEIISADAIRDIYYAEYKKPLHKRRALSGWSEDDVKEFLKRFGIESLAEKEVLEQFRHVDD